MGTMTLHFLDQTLVGLGGKCLESRRRSVPARRRNWRMYGLDVPLHKSS